MLLKFLCNICHNGQVIRIQQPKGCCSRCCFANYIQQSDKQGLRADPCDRPNTVLTAVLASLYVSWKNLIRLLLGTLFLLRHPEALFFSRSTNTWHNFLFCSRYLSCRCRTIKIAAFVVPFLAWIQTVGCILWPFPSTLGGILFSGFLLSGSILHRTKGSAFAVCQ